MGLLGLGKPEEALGSLKEAARLAPTDPELQLQLGAALQRLQRFEQACDAFQAATRLDATNAVGWGARGLTAAQLHRQTEAAEYWDRAVHLDPNYFEGRPEERAIHDQIGTALATPR
jgi:tetratricopeptide (TPR) repeat protein